MSELTARQRAFIEELPKNQWNGSRAAIAAGYARKSAGVMAHRLLKNPKIVAELEKRTAEIVQKTDVEVGEIIVALREIAFGGRATNSDRLRALDLLGRFKSMYTDRVVTEQEEHKPLSKEEERAADAWAGFRLSSCYPDLDAYAAHRARNRPETGQIEKTAPAATEHVLPIRGTP